MYAVINKKIVASPAGFFFFFFNSKTGKSSLSSQVQPLKGFDMQACVGIIVFSEQI